MMTEKTIRPIPEWQMERLLLDELPRQEEEDVREALQASPNERLRLDALERASRDFLANQPPPQVAALIKARMMTETPSTVPSPSRFWRPVWRPALAATMLTAAVALTVWTAGPRFAGSPSTASTRIKGLQPQLVLYRKTTLGIEQLIPGSVARKGDLVQILYQAAGKHYGAIVSVDGRGIITRHLPDHGAHAVTLEAGQLVPLPSAYQLDDAPRFECFYLVASDRPFEVATVMDAAHRVAVATKGGSETGRLLELPEGLDQYAFMLEKEKAR